MARPLLLDLFCGAGGAAVGYHRAGFDVVGIDIEPQPHYPFEFIQADAMDYRSDQLAAFAAVHASPPCQAYSSGSRMQTGKVEREYPRLIEPIRELLVASGLPYVIENVPEAPLRDAILLCGSSFGITAMEGVRRHRLFESNRHLMALKCMHGLLTTTVGVYGDHPENSVIRKGHPAIRARSVEHAQEVMGMPWVPDWHGLKEAIPPAYTEFIGAQLIEHLERVA